MPDSPKWNTYQVVAITTVIAVVFLIFVGGLVRASGAGLGCPDWPKCFGSWIPPFSADQLPPAFDESQFNAVKTWTEYINRLIGVVIGLLIAATFTLSFQYRKIKPAVFYSSFAALFMVLVQGWLGGQVVITGLDAWLITFHMILAMAIMTTLIYGAWKSSEDKITADIQPEYRDHIFWAGVILGGLTLVQLVLGTQVREAVDLVKNAEPAVPRELWLNEAGVIEKIHRSFSWTILLAGSVLFYFCRWKASSKIISKIGTGILAVIILQVLLGAGLYYLGMPPGYQVLHLVGVAVLIGLEFILLLLINKQGPGLNFLSQ